MRPFRYGTLSRCVRTELRMGAANHSTIKTEIGIRAEFKVCMNSVATLRLLAEDTWAPNDETEIVSLWVG